MKTIITISLSVLTFFGCDKEKGEVVCSDAEFIFVNQNGEDIFSDSTEGHLEISAFCIYTPDNSVTLNYYVYNTNDTNYFEPGNNLSYMYEFQIGINGLLGDGITYLKFGDISVDTIYAKYKEKGNSLFISELYYNDSLIENNDGGTQCGTNTHIITVKED